MNLCFIRRIGQSSTSRAIIYTDGACPFNGQGATTAGIGVFWGNAHPNNLSRPLGEGPITNNRAEILAAAEGIRQARTLGYNAVTVRVDSQYLIDSVNKWMPRWQDNGFKNSKGKLVKNKGDFLYLQECMEGIEVDFEKVAAHTDIGNKEADYLARQAAKAPSL